MSHFATRGVVVSSVDRMTAPYRVVAVSGSLHEPSKTTALVRAIAGAVAERAEVEIEVIELTDIGRRWPAPCAATSCRRESRRSSSRSRAPIC